MLYNIFKSKESKVFVVTSTVCIMSFAIYAGTKIYSQLDDWTIQRFEMESMQDARSYLKESAVDYIGKMDGISLLVGRGYGKLSNHVAQGIMTADYESKSVEADWHEMIGSYGYLLGGLIILFYIYMCFKSYRLYKYDKSIDNLSYLAITLLFVTIAYFAGHAFSNVLVAPIYAIVISNILVQDNDLYES